MRWMLVAFDCLWAMVLGGFGWLVMSVLCGDATKGLFLSLAMGAVKLAIIRIHERRVRQKWLRGAETAGKRLAHTLILAAEFFALVGAGAYCASGDAAAAVIVGVVGAAGNTLIAAVYRQVRQRVARFAVRGAIRTQGGHRKSVCSQSSYVPCEYCSKCTRA